MNDQKKLLSPLVIIQVLFLVILLPFLPLFVS